MISTSIRRSFSILLCAVLAVAASWARADPPAYVARLAYVSGDASFSPGGERDWGRAVINRPLVTGDRLWVDRGARAELQLGVAAIRIGPQTSIAFLNMDDRVVQVQLTQGTLNIQVRRLDRGEVFEIDTPNLAYSIRRPGNYRIEVAPDGRATAVTARAGLADVFGEGRAFVTLERRTYRFYDTALRDYDVFAARPLDELDRWAAERERRRESASSRRYVAAEIIGYDDLDRYGSWRKVANYGFVWVPSRTPANWAPYRDGHWAWIEPWGWTWIDEEPWGFATSHYGRWAFVERSWVWVPGPTKVRPVYAPALVAFVNGGGGTVGWFPLGPRDVYRPSYTVSREYFDRVNTSSTVLDRTVINNYYSNRSTTNVTYVNQQVPGAVIAMLAAAFSQSKPVPQDHPRMTRENAGRAQVTAVAPVAPVHASVVTAPVNAKPPEAAVQRPVVAQVKPPPPPVPFAAKQRELANNGGKPLDAAAVAALKPAASAPEAPKVKVVEATKPVAAPTTPASGRAASSAAAASAASAPSAAASARAGASAPAASASAPAAGEKPGRPGAEQERGRGRGRDAQGRGEPPSREAPNSAPSAGAASAPAQPAKGPASSPSPAARPGQPPEQNKPAAPPVPGAAPPVRGAAPPESAPASASQPPQGNRPALPPQASPAARPAPQSPKAAEPPQAASEPQPQRESRGRGRDASERGGPGNAAAQRSAQPPAPPPPAAPPAATPPEAKPPAAKAPESKPPEAKPPAAKAPESKPPAPTPPAAKGPEAKPAEAKPPAPQPPAAAAPPQAQPQAQSPEAKPPAAKPAEANPPARGPAAAAPAAEERANRAAAAQAQASARREAASERRRGRGEEERKP